MYLQSPRGVVEPQRRRQELVLPLLILHMSVGPVGPVSAVGEVVPVGEVLPLCAGPVGLTGLLRRSAVHPRRAPINRRTHGALSVEFN